MFVFWIIAKSAVFSIIVVSKNKRYPEFILYGWSFIETQVFPDLIDMKFPDRSSSSRKKRATKIEIDFNSLITQGLQRDRDKEAKKQEKKERRRRAQKAAGGPKDLL